MRIFRDMELVEQLGSGVPRILQAYGEDCFYFSENYIRMSFPAKEKMDSDRLNEGLKTLLTEIRNYEGTQAKDLATILDNRPLKTIERQIAQLIDKGLIERRGSRKTGGYFIKNVGALNLSLKKHKPPITK